MQGRNPARFNGGYGVPRGFKGEKSKSPPNPLGLAERVLHPQVVEGVLADGGRRMGAHRAPVYLPFPHFRTFSPQFRNSVLE